MVNANLVRFAALIALSGCAADPKENALDWLKGDVRTIVVRVEDQLGRPGYQVHESRALEGAGEGAAGGALGSLVGGLSTANPFGFAAGIVLMPVFAMSGAVYGAATADPEVHVLPLERLEGASALSVSEFRGENLQELIKRKIGERSPTPSGHSIVFGRNILENETKSGGEPLDKGNKIKSDVANIRLYIKNYAFVGETAENSNVSLLIDGGGVLETPGGGWSSFDWSFESSNRDISEWSSNKAELFRHEVGRAADFIADRVIENIEVTDTFLQTR